MTAPKTDRPSKIDMGDRSSSGLFH